MAAGDPINGLLTGGLGCELPACAMIITATTFTLGPIIVTIQPPLDGGSAPMAPGEIQNFYKPIDKVNDQPTDDIWVPYESKHRSRIVKVTISMGGKTTTKEYGVREDRLKILLNVTNMVGRVMGGITIKVVALKKITARATVKILNLRKLFDRS